jgi:hypothetical protein
VLINRASRLFFAIAPTSRVSVDLPHFTITSPAYARKKTRLRQEAGWLPGDLILVFKLGTGIKRQPLLNPSRASAIQIGLTGRFQQQHVGGRMIRSSNLNLINLEAQ